MNGADLVKSLQDYYGVKYTEIEKPVVAAWLKAEYAKYGPDHLDSVWEQVTTDVSKNFGKVPDKALLNTAAEKVRPARDPHVLPALSAPVDTPMTPEDEQAWYEAELGIRAVAARYGKPISDTRIQAQVKAIDETNRDKVGEETGLPGLSNVRKGQTVGKTPLTVISATGNESKASQPRQETPGFDFGPQSCIRGPADQGTSQQNESSQDQGGPK